ncbi:MAG: pyridoxamine 5'-phosphate oxidase family protein [Candidatus Hodarchaeota archaeon]
MSIEELKEEEKIRLELDYETKKEEKIKFLESEDNAAMVLATSHNDRVIARNVLIVSSGLDIYFGTWEHSRKCMQIRENPRVALCKDDVQIEGLAEILGDLLDEKNKEYADMLRNRFPSSFEYWEDKPGMVIVRVKPELIVSGITIIDDQPYLEFLDLENEIAYAERWAYY